MEIDLFQNSKVIKLHDTDFDFTDPVKLKHNSFKHKDGYLMVYAPWCPNCQNKVPFWSLFGDKFNTDPTYAKENFKIGVISTTDPKAAKIVEELNITYIPRFFHVTSDEQGHGLLSDFKGQDHSPDTLLSEVCQEKHKLCHIKSKLINN